MKDGSVPLGNFVCDLIRRALGFTPGGAAGASCARRLS